MTQITKEAILAALSKVQEPELHQDLVTLNMIRELEATDNWTFSFMGTTIDAIAVATDMNIRRENALHFEKKDMKSTMHRVAKEMQDYAHEKSKGNRVKDFLKEDPASKS